MDMSRRRFLSIIGLTLMAPSIMVSPSASMTPKRQWKISPEDPLGQRWVEVAFLERLHEEVAILPM